MTLFDAFTSGVLETLGALTVTSGIAVIRACWNTPIIQLARSKLARALEPHREPPMAT